MKRILFSLAFVAAIGGAFATKHSPSIAGFQQVGTSCNSVGTVPSACTLTSGVACSGYYFNKQDGSTCFSQRYRP